MRSLLVPVLAAFGLAAGAAAAQTPEAGRRPCFDLAVIATSPSYHWGPVPQAGPDEIIIRSPVELTFDVEETMAGAIEPETVTVDAVLHTRFNPRIAFFLLFLKRKPSGHYALVESSYQIVQQYDGEFAWPLAGPLSDNYVDPDGLLPSDYERMMRPLAYRSKDAWWLRGRRHGDEPLAASDYPWGVIEAGTHVLAPRGLRVRDLVSAAANRRCRGG